MTKKQDKVKEGVADAMADWLAQHPVSLGDLFAEAVEKAVGKWMDYHEDEITEAITEAAFKHQTINLMEAVKEERAEWSASRRIGCAEYVPKTNVIRLYVYAGGADYEVDLDDCVTPAELIGWLFHLAGKKWCVGGVLTDFILCLDKAIEERHGKSAEEFFGVHNREGNLEGTNDEGN